MAKEYFAAELPDAKPGTAQGTTGHSRIDAFDLGRTLFPQPKPFPFLGTEIAGEWESANGEALCHDHIRGWLDPSPDSNKTDPETPIRLPKTSCDYPRW